MEPVLKIENLSHSYHSLEGETPALSGLTFTAHKGEFISIVGPSGCGKSTLLSLIAGLLKPEEGSISLEGSKVGYMLQRDHLLPWRNLLKNITLGPEILGRLTPEAKEKAGNFLEQYGLLDFQNAKPESLSGGMRQRAALIRTLMTEPDLLLLDEPFSALDYQTRLKVSDEIGRIIRREGRSAILVTHDLSEAICMGDKVLVLTGRPASIKKTISLSFSSTEEGPLARRNAPEFKCYFNEVWKEFNENGW